MEWTSLGFLDGLLRDFRSGGGGVSLLLILELLYMSRARCTCGGNVSIMPSSDSGTELGEEQAVFDASTIFSVVVCS